MKTYQFISHPKIGLLQQTNETERPNFEEKTVKCLAVNYRQPLEIKEGLPPFYSKREIKIQVKTKEYVIKGRYVATLKVFLDLQHLKSE